MQQVFFNFQGNAVFAVLVFLGTCFALFLAAAALAYFRAVRRPRLARITLAMAVTGVAAYFAALLAFSLTSREQVVGLKEEKYFCEVDCHLAYSVIKVTRTKTLGTPPNQSAARGEYYVVTVKVRFDENTISKRRPRDMPLKPNSRTVTIIGDEGKPYVESPEGLKSLESVEGKRIPLTRALRPGEFYTTDLVFDLPSNVKNPRLLITEASPVRRFLIGHENSFFHKKTGFRLDSES